MKVSSRFQQGEGLSRGLHYNFKLREGSFEALELSMKMLGERAGVGEAR